MHKQLSWLIFGAGAIGTYIGGLLSLHEHHVAFIERPEVARRLRSKGIRLEINGERHQVTNPFIGETLTEVLRAGPFDVAVFALKSYDTEPALENIAASKDQLPPFLCLQNGVENEQALATVLGAEKVIAGTVTSAVTRREAGDVILERERGMGIASDHPLSEVLSVALNNAGIHTRLYARALDMKWSKLVTNLLANASSAILDMSPQEIFEQPKLFRLEIAQIREALSVMEAQKYQVVNLPGTPVRALSGVVRHLPAGISRPLLQGRMGKGRGGKMPSLHIDLHSGNPRSEVDWLNGAVVRYGEIFGRPTPVNRALNNTLLGIIGGTIPRDKFFRQPDELLRLAEIN